MSISIEQIKAVASQAEGFATSARASLEHLRGCLESHIKGHFITTQEKQFGKRQGRAVHVTLEGYNIFVHFNPLKDDREVSRMLRKVHVADIIEVREAVS